MAQVKYMLFYQWIM